jgi:hypothetical protein
MAAVTPTDLIRSTEPGNTGRLSLSLFPKYTAEQLEALLQAQLDAAYAELGSAGTEAERNRLASGFAYAQAYDEALVQSFDEATEVRLDNLGTRKKDVGTKRNTIQGWANGYRAQWDAGLSTPVENGGIPASGSAPVRITSR